jgi:hypothetical protein
VGAFKGFVRAPFSEAGEAMIVLRNHAWAGGELEEFGQLAAARPNGTAVTIRRFKAQQRAVHNKAATVIILRAVVGLSFAVRWPRAEHLVLIAQAAWEANRAELEMRTFRTFKEFLRVVECAVCILCGPAFSEGMVVARGGPGRPLPPEWLRCSRRPSSQPSGRQRIPARRHGCRAKPPSLGDTLTGRVRDQLRQVVESRAQEGRDRPRCCSSRCWSQQRCRQR